LLIKNNKKTSTLKKLIIFSSVIFLFTSSHAQENYFGIFAGASNYSGDLQPKRYTFTESHPAFGILYEKGITPNFSYRGELSFAQISGSDRYGKDSGDVLRNLSFQSNIIEFQVAGEYSLWSLSQKRFTPYVFLGLAVFHFNPQAYDTSGQLVDLQPLSTEGEGLSSYPGRKAYSLTQLAIPFGGGIKFAISQNVILGLEMDLRKTFTDYLDDVSTTYVDETTLLKDRNQLAVEMAYRTNELPGHQSDPYPAAGTQRGSSRYKDWYYYTGITLVFRLNNGGESGHTPRYAKCPSY
jgi:Domain of unknown function (DUF6089)